jgi:hypothetical protein
MSFRTTERNLNVLQIKAFKISPRTSFEMTFILLCCNSRIHLNNLYYKIIL